MYNVIINTAVVETDGSAKARQSHPSAASWGKLVKYFTAERLHALIT